MNGSEKFREVARVLGEKRNELQNLFEGKRDKVEVSDIMKIVVVPDEVKEYMKEAVSNTLSYIYKGLPFGEKFISPLHAAYRTVMIASPMIKMNKMTHFRTHGNHAYFPYIDSQMRDVFCLVYLASIYPDEKCYSEANVFIPIVKSSLPWLDLKNDKLNFKNLAYSDDAELFFKKKEKETFDGKWLLGDEFALARKYMRKFIAKGRKNFYPDTFTKVNTVNDKGNKVEFLLVHSSDYRTYFMGKAEDYLFIHASILANLKPGKK